MHTVELADIRIRAALPLHSYLYNHPHLFLRLASDEGVCGDTDGADGNLASGIWEFSTRLYAPRVEKSLNIAVLAGVKGPGIQVVSVTLRVAELLAQKKACPNRHQYIVIFDFHAAIHLKLVVTCSIKLSLDRVPQADGDKGNPVDWRSGNDQSDFDPTKMDWSSREDLETLYRTIIHRPDRDETKARILSDIGLAYCFLYNQEYKRSDTEKAISIQEEATRLTGLFHPHLALHTYRFAVALLGRFQQNGDYADIERAISYFRTALRFTEDLDPARPSRFGHLGYALQLRFQRFGCLADLETSILYQREAIRVTPNDHPDKSDLFTALGLALRARFLRLGVLRDLEDAVSNLQQAAQLMPDGHPNKPSRFNNLGLTLQSRFERLGVLRDSEDAVSNLRQAVQLTPDGNPDKPETFSNLGVALRSRFARLDDLTDLEDAISKLRQAVQLTPDGHPDKPRRFNNLRLTLQSRFERLGVLKDLQDAILNLRQGVQLTADGHPDKSSLFTNLGIALRSRFARLDDLTDLEDATSNLRQAVKLMPDNHPDKAGRSNNLGLTLRSCFERLGVLKDLEDAISNLRQGVQLTADGHPDKPSLFSNLGLALQSRYERLGILTDLEDAISNLRLAVQLFPDSHTDKPGRFDELGVALIRRFECLGVLKDLEDAISNLRQAIQLTPDAHPYKPARFNNLGLALRSRFERLGILRDLEDVISVFRQVVQLTPDGHSNKPSLFCNLGSALHDLFLRLGALRDLEDALSNLRQAVQFMPDGHPREPGLVSHMGNALLSRFEHLGVLADLENAISNLRLAVQLAPDDRPDKVAQLCHLGIAFLRRFRRLDIASDLESALSALSTAANSVTGSAMGRFKAARTWARVAEEESRSPLDAFECAINLLPRIAWLGLAVTDQHTLLADVGGIVRDAVSAAIRYEEYETAVVWAEQGRSIVWQNLLGLRNHVDDLREAYPELANQLRRIAAHLEGSVSHEPLGDNKKEAPVEDISHKYSKLALEWDRLVDEIRRIPTFEGFLKPKSFSQLAPAAHEGPVVILNVSGARCDALILISDDSVERNVSVVNITLERFSHEKSKNMFQKLNELLSLAGVRERSERKTGRAQSRVDGDAKFKVLLGVLWQDIVKPVIEGLAFQTESNRPHRIWWCTTGLLAFLPIHAAGLYDTQDVGERISDYVVSSYTPTLTAILELSDPVVQEDFQVLAVAQASAPGAPPIPKTEDEVKIVRSLLASARVLNLTGENATVERVRDGMIKSNWIHLACHGKQNSDNPMESGFLLHDRMFELSEIVKMSLPKAEFAFLSACQTATGNEKVAEESVHLAAGMFLSGCKSVVATTWSIRDDDAPKIAEDVYSQIFKDGKPNRKEAAYALHEAVKRLRESGAQCTSWVPFIHIGR